MNHWKPIALCIAFAGSLALQAAESELPLEIFNRIRVEYDDNVGNSPDAIEQYESFKLIEELELLVDADLQNTYVGLRYMPAFILYDDRPGDDTDLDHQLDLILTQSFSPRTTLRFKDTLRVTEDPALVDDDVTIRNNNDFVYNSANVSLETQVVPDKTSLRVDGRYAFIDYDEDRAASALNYDNAVAGLDVVQQLSPNSTASFETRYSTFDYDDDLRDSDVVQVGVAGTMIFTPKLQGDVRVGFQNRESDKAQASEKDSGYLSGSLVYLHSERSRVTLGAGISDDKSPTSIYVSQERVRIFASFVQSLTARLSLRVSGVWSEGDFDVDDATVANGLAQGGEETSTSFSSTLAYQIGTRNWLECSYQYVDLESDVRSASNYDRSRASIGWKISL